MDDLDHILETRGTVRALLYLAEAVEELTEDKRVLQIEVDFYRTSLEKEDYDGLAELPYLE